MRPQLEARAADADIIVLVDAGALRCKVILGNVGCDRSLNELSIHIDAAPPACTNLITCNSRLRISLRRMESGGGACQGRWKSEMYTLWVDWDSFCFAAPYAPALQATPPHTWFCTMVAVLRRSPTLTRERRSPGGPLGGPLLPSAEATAARAKSASRASAMVFVEAMVLHGLGRGEGRWGQGSKMAHDEGKRQCLQMGAPMRIAAVRILN